MNAETIKFLYDILDGISKIRFHIQNINSSVEFISNVTVLCQLFTIVSFLMF